MAITSDDVATLQLVAVVSEVMHPVADDLTSHLHLAVPIQPEVPAGCGLL